MAREVTILTPEQVEVKFELAGIGSRFVARLIDSLIQSLVFVVLILFVFAMGAMSSFDRGPSTATIWMFAIFIVLLFVAQYGYFLYFEAAKNGQTPGKKAAGIRVVRDSGHPIDFRCALLRNVMRIVDELGGMMPIGLVSMFFSSEYRRLGDYVGGSLVVKVGRKPEMLPDRGVQTPESSAVDQLTAQEPPTQPASLLPPEAMPLLATVTRDEYRAIRHFLDRRAELADDVAYNLSAKIAEPIAAKLKLDPAGLGDKVTFLQAVCSEWEKRMIH